MRQILAWALYDLANTFFAVGMISFYFPLWLVEEQGQKELVFSAAMAVSTVCVAVLMPFCGAVSDAVGQRMPFLRWTTYACAAATAAIAFTPRAVPALLLFGFANVCYQLGTVSMTRSSGSCPRPSGSAPRPASARRSATLAARWDCCFCGPLSGRAATPRRSDRPRCTSCCSRCPAFS
jgi:MFS family permease